MGVKDFGSQLMAARKEKGFTQEQLSVRLGVTPQAVSKWERGNGYPDMELLCCLSEVLECSLDYLLHLEGKKVRLTENNDEQTAKQLLEKVLSEPLVLEAGVGFIDLLTHEYNNQFPGIRALRDEIAVKYGFLLPVLRIRDNENINKLEYRILAYDQPLFSKTLKTMDGVTFQEICKCIEMKVVEHFDKIVNRQMIQTLLDNVAEKYPAAVRGVVPEKISLALLQAVLAGLIMKKKSIRNLIKIIEILENEIENTTDTKSLVELIIAKLNL